MTIYLTEPKNLEAGLWWARRIRADRTTGRDAWFIAEVKGAVPFLSVRTVLYCTSDHRWVEPSSELGAITDTSALEFGPRIDIPSDKARAEYPPMERKP